MIRKILWVLLWLCFGFYLGIRFESWFGVDFGGSVENAFIFVENSILGAFQLLYNWVASLF